MWKLIVCVSFFLVSIGCSPKLRYPVEEIKRPLSLPPKNWGLSLGIGPAWTNYSTETLPIAKTHIPPGYLPVFAYPYVPLFEGWLELHFSLLKLKYYPVRNVEIVDSTLCITGPNLAVGGGASIETVDFFIAGFEAPFPWHLFAQYKAPVRQNLWLSAVANFHRRTHRVYHSTSAQIQAGCGYQFTRNLYATIDLDASYYKAILPRVDFVFNENNRGEWIIYGAEYEQLTTQLPIQLGYNFGRQWKVFVTGLAGYYFKHEVFYGGGTAGFDFYW